MVTEDVKIRIAVEDKASDKLKKINKSVSDFEPKFAGWAMSLMFAGMALERTFNSIAKFGLKTFNDVAHSVEGTVTASDKLQGSMQYLGFIVGEALQPFLEFLIPIIDGIANWASENETLVGWIITLGIVLGSALTIFGMTKLALNSIGAVLAYFGVVISTTVLAVSAFVVALGAILLWWNKAQKEMGGWGDFFLNALKGILRLVAMFAGAAWGIVQEAWNSIKFLWNGIVTFIEGGINLIISAINKLTGLLGIKIPKVDFSGAKMSTNGLGSSFMSGYGDVMNAYLNFENQYLTTGNQQSSGTTINIQSVKVENPKNFADFVDEINKRKTGVSTLI